MCGRYRIKDPRRVAELINLLIEGELTLVELAERYNIHPDEFQRIVHPSGNGVTITSMRWGFVPFWEKSPKPRLAPINARSGEAFSKPMFRQAIQKRRCLVPADGFYEWPRVDTGLRQPSFFSLRREEPFFFAGIYEEEAAGLRPATYSIFTTAPNELLSRLPHDRMPVILDIERAREWLEPGPIAESRFLDLCQSFPAERMQSWPVSTYVNKPFNEGPQCSAPVTAETPPDRLSQGTFEF